MAHNPAVRKAMKAAKRKAIVAEKRKLERSTNSLSGRIAEAAAQPVLHCVVSDGLFEFGIGTVVLVRGLSPEYQQIAIFLLDTYCLGVKDVVFRAMDRAAAEAMLEHVSTSEPKSPMEPAEARKLLRDLAAWSEANGFPPHKDYAALERIFGGIAPAETDWTPRFGQDGKIFYVAGPNDTPAQIRQRLAIVRARSGDFMVPATTFVPADDDAYDDDDDTIDGEAEDVG